MYIREEDLALVCLREQGEAPIEIDLREILRVEARQIDVQYVTPGKAPELLTTFNIAWRDLHQAISMLELEKLRAQKSLDKRRATILLDVVPGVLKEKGVASTVDNRQAVIDLDPEYVECKERVDSIQCAIDFLAGKLKSFERAHQSVSRIMNHDTYNMSSKENPRLTHTPSEQNIPRGFGKPKL